MMNKKPLVGISTCLLGENVRHDGGHKLNRYLRDVLGQYVDYYPVCPEVECGLTTPREAMRLVENDGKICLMTQKTAEDKTAQMNRWMRKKLTELSGVHLCGFIFKSKSPSSGLMRVKVYRKNGFAKDGTGIFAHGFTENFSFIPAEEDGRMNDPSLRENFIERIFVMKRWYSICTGRKSLKKIMDFHSMHKYMLMAHCPKTLKELGTFLAKGENYPADNVYKDYFSRFITALSKIATVKRNTNVLQHIMGYFKRDLNSDEKQELNEIIENYHSGLVPLIVPVTLLNHYNRKYRSEYLNDQVYLHPHPMELMLRNHV